MATNWTGLTLFEAGDIELPALFGGLPSAYDTNLQSKVKRDFERRIKSKFIGVGKLTLTTTDNFDIEEVSNGSILKESALLWNNLLIARDNMTDIDDRDDKYGSYYANNKKWIDEQIEQDLNLLQFNEPSGVNQLFKRYTGLVT